MTTIFRLTGANFAGKGLPNLFPFVSKADMEYAFDFRNRATRLSDLVGKHTITPKRTEITAGILNVTDPTVITTDATGLGITMTYGYLQCNLPLAPIPVDGSKQFTVMVVGGYSGVAFPTEKVALSAPVAATLFDYGSVVMSYAGFTIDANTLSNTSGPRIEHSVQSFITDTYLNVDKKLVHFLTFNGSTWTYYSKTLNKVYSGTNAALNVTGNPIAVNVTNVDGMLNLGGNANQTSSLHGHAPTIYQQAMWNRVLTPTEIEAQYQMTKSNFAALNL